MLLQVGHHVGAIGLVDPESELLRGSTDDLAPVIPRCLLAGVVDFYDASILEGADGDGAGTRPEGGGEFSFRHPQGALCLDPFRDVVSHASHDGSRHTVGSKCASKLPHASLAGAGHDGQEPACDPVSPEVGNVRIEPVSGIRSEQLRNGHTRELVRRVPQNPSRRVVDREKSTLEVMGGDQVFTVLDQVAIPVFAVSKRLFDSTAFADFRLKDGVLVEGLTLAPETLLECPSAIA